MSLPTRKMPLARRWSTISPPGISSCPPYPPTQDPRARLPDCRVLALKRHDIELAIKFGMGGFPSKRRTESMDRKGLMRSRSGICSRIITSLHGVGEGRVSRDGRTFENIQLSLE